MADGPGIYDEQATQARESTGAEAIILIVLNGKNGSGFSMQAYQSMPPHKVAAMLEDTARQIRATPGVASFS